MARDPKFVFEYLKQVESLATEVLADRRDIIELNKKRDKAREASRALRKSEEPNDSQTFVCFGNLFVSLTKQQGSILIEKDLSTFDQEINKIHSNLKSKVNKLNDAENKPELKGFNLVPLSKEEKQSLFDLTGIH